MNKASTVDERSRDQAAQEDVPLRESRRGGWRLISLVFSLGAVAGVLESIFQLDGMVSTSFQLLVVWMMFWSFGGSFRRASWRFRSIGYSLIGFVLLVVVACLIAQFSGKRVDYLEMWRYVIQVYFCTLVFWGVAGWAYRRFDVRSIDLGVAVLATLAVTSVLIEFFGITSFESYGSRNFGFLGDSVAWLLSFPIVYFLFRRRHWSLLTLSVVSLLITESRGALIVVFGSLILYNLFSSESLARKFGQAIIMASFILIAIFSGLGAKGLGRFDGLDLVENDRVQTAIFSALIFLENPYFGGGYGIHSLKFQALGITNDDPGVQTWVIPTNTFLQILSEFGLIGFAVWALFLYLLIVACWRVLRNVRTEPRFRVILGLTLWLVAFLLLNHSAAWLLPGSKLLVLVFASAGAVVGFSARLVAGRRVREIR